MSISPIGFTPGLTGVTSLPALPQPTAPAVTAPAEDFGNLVTEGLERLQAMHDSTDNLAVQAATGDLKDIHDYMISSTQTGIATEMTVAVRNKAVEAFHEIMRMQV